MIIILKAPGRRLNVIGLDGEDITLPKKLIPTIMTFPMSCQVLKEIKFMFVFFLYVIM